MANHVDNEVKLTITHVPFLIETLSRFAYKWKEMGTALKFQPQDLRNIEAFPSLIATAPSSFMQRLVEEWLEGKYPHTAPPTIANLLKALNSHTVGLGTLATQIRDSLPQYDQSVDANIFEIAAVSDQGDITFNRIEDIRVTEHTQVHLEIKTSSEKQMCRWSNTHLKNSSEEQLNIESTQPIIRPRRVLKRNNKPPIDKLCSDSNKPVINILRADIDIDGSQFSCSINDHNTSITSQITPVTFRVSCPQLDKFKDKLAFVYLAQPEVPQDSWPPVSNKTFINLALIKQEQSINYGGEYARLTIRGDIDDILHHKEIIEYENIFDGLRSGSLLLIEGRPGCGKTTFVHKITRDWAASEVKGPMRLVLLVSLRVLNTWDKPVTLEDILNLLNLRILEKTLDERNGKGVCFIFDGLDEFSPLEGENSIVYKIIYKTYLPQSIVIVASRPAALVNLRQRANKIVEVIGFPRDQIFEYFENYFHLNRSKAVELRSYLTSHPNVLHMCYLPIHAAMVAFLFENVGEVPRTETEIYKHFTHSTLMRSLSKKKRQDEIVYMNTNELLSGEEKELFNTICVCAFEITALNKQVLDQDREMKLLLQSKEIEGIALGLVTVDRTPGLYGFKNIYTFLHLTYQEYLAAVHISTLSDEDQQRLIEQYGDKDHMQVVWKFYFGLVNFEGHEYKIRALVNRRKEMCLFDIQCAYESQQEIVCNCLMEEMDAQIMLKDKYLTTPDFTALGYLLANSRKPASLLFNNSEIDIEAVEAVLAETQGKPPSLHSLICESCYSSLTSIRKLLLHLHGLKIFKFCIDGEYDRDCVSTSMIDYGFVEMIESYGFVEHKSQSPFKSLDDFDFSDTVSTSLVYLKELSISGFQVGSKMLSSVLQFCKELTSLILYYCTEEHAIETLLSEFSKCKKLETVSCSSPTNQETVYYVEISKTAKKFNKLYTFYEVIGSVLYVEGVRSDYFQTLTVISKNMDPIPTACLECFLPSRIKVLEVHLHYEDDTFSSIVEHIPDFSALEKLVLTGYFLDETLLADILGYCTALQEVDLSFFPSEIENILNGLRSCKNLKILTLNNFLNADGDVYVLASYLQHWPKLCDLNIKNWVIGEERYKTAAYYIKAYWPKLVINPIQEKVRQLEGKQIYGYSIEMRKKREEAKLCSQEASSCSIGEEGTCEVFADNIEHCHELTDLAEGREKNEETKSSLQNDSSCCCTLF